jgi:hypothetical protein
VKTSQSRTSDTLPKQTFLILLDVQGVLHDYTTLIEFLDCHGWRLLHRGTTTCAGLIHTGLAQAEIESELRRLGNDADRCQVIPRRDLDWFGVIQTADERLGEWLEGLPEWGAWKRPHA